jgi:hypothetical protein
MKMKVKQHNLLNYCFLLALLCMLRVESIATTPCFILNASFLSDSLAGQDTTKYRGYRLDLTKFEVLKKTDEWLKIRFTAVNSGRMDVDLGKEEAAHWVQINFDQSLFEQKLGGLRDKIREELIRKGFRLEPGKVATDYELKVSTMPSLPRKPTEETISITENSTSEPVGFEAKGGSELSQADDEAFYRKKEECPDVSFTRLDIEEQDDKWATLTYTITNQGKGPFHLYGDKDGTEHNLVLRAYISGVPKLSRGALSIGGQFVKDASGLPPSLQPGESASSKIRLDVRKKTRYLKSLILSLDSNQFSYECDKTNNTAAVILD